MDNKVQFEEENALFTSRKLFGEPVEPALSRLLRRWGFVKNSSQAKWFMLVIIILCLGVSAYLLVNTFDPGAFHSAPKKTSTIGVRGHIGNTQ